MTGSGLLDNDVPEISLRKRYTETDDDLIKNRLKKMQQIEENRKKAALQEFIKKEEAMK